MKELISKIIREFQIEGEVCEVKELTSGMINLTVKASVLNNGEVVNYLVQRVNGFVFNDPVAVMNNIAKVTEHINKKNLENGITDPRYGLNFYKTAEGNNYLFVEDENGRNLWRVSNFIEKSVSFDTGNDEKVLRMAGEAFGQFEVKLSDFDASSLVETIPDFHNTRKRLDKFFADVEKDEVGRVKEVSEEIALIAKYREYASRLSNAMESGELPLRVTHNDTKTNNVLFDADTLAPLCVIDLDTVMPGLAAFDFGDTIRFAANTAAEDEKDLDKVSFNIDMFKAFAEGYIGQTRCLLSDAELESMADGAATITLELASRFLDDYITGDKYFKIAYPEHNLVRTRCQLKLFKCMMEKLDEMKEILKNIA